MSQAAQDASTPEQLYTLPPEQFTAARDAAAKQAKADGDRERAAALGALRRPSVAAWLVNALAREHADLLEQLLALGPALAEAQAAGSGGDLRALGEQRRRLVEAVVEQAVSAAERPVTAAVRAEVAGTLEAALADPASADAVRSGLLVRALSFAGFGGVDLDGAVAAPPATRTRQKAPPKGRPDKGPDRETAKRAREAEREAERQVEAAERAAHAAGGALDDAVRRCEDAARARDRAAQAAAAARDEVERQERELAAARERQDEADDRAGQAQHEADRALEQVQGAQAEAEAARTALDRLRRGGRPGR